MPASQARLPWSTSRLTVGVAGPRLRRAMGAFFLRACPLLLVLLISLLLVPAAAPLAWGSPTPSPTSAGFESLGPPIEITGPDLELDLAGRVRYFLSTEIDAPPSSIAARIAAGEKPLERSGEADFVRVREDVWLAFRVASLRDAPTELVLRSKSTLLARFDAALVDERTGRVLHHGLNGSAIPFEERPVGTAFYEHPFVLPVRTEGVVLVRLQSRWHLRTGAVLLAGRAARDSSSYVLLLRGAFFGVVLGLLLYNLCLFLLLRTALQAYYLFFLLSLGGALLVSNEVVEVLTRGALEPNESFVSGYFPVFAPLFYALFGGKYLQLGEAGARTRRAYRALVILSAPLPVLALVLPRDWGIPVQDATGAIVMIGMVAFGAAAWVGGRSGAKWFFAGALTLVTFIGAWFLVRAGVLPGTVAAYHLADVGISAQLLFFSMGVAERYREMQRAIQTLAQEKALLLERRLDETEQEMVARARLSSLGEMAGNVAHEINNPLTIILGNLDRLEMMAGARIVVPDTAPRAAAAVSTDSASPVAPSDESLLPVLRIRQAAERIARIVRSMRLLARDDGTVETQEVDLPSIAFETLGLCQERYRARGVELVFLNEASEHGSVALLVRVNPVQIGQALLNLIGNALFAATHGGAEGHRVEVVLSREGNEAVLRVRDWGAGVPDEVRAKLFQPFFTTKPVGEGTGLGLSLSRRLVEANGGRLGLENPRAPTCFALRLPLAG